MEPHTNADDSHHTPAQALNSELENLATSVELTLASVLQGIALAILVPRIADLIASGQIAKFPYIPASLLLIFLVWVAFINHALAVLSWPFDPLHNMLYFLVVTSETVLLIFLDQPAHWCLALVGFGIVFGSNCWYNQRLLRRSAMHYSNAAGRDLDSHLFNEQQISVYIAAGYCVIGLLGWLALVWWPTLGLAPELGWLVTGLLVLILPGAHVYWQARATTQLARLLERVKT